MDNVGKTSICGMLRDKLVSSGREIVLVSDPPRIPPWDGWKETIEGHKDLTTPSRALLYLAARVDSCSRVIAPALKRNATVIADRYIDSWFAYQVTALENVMDREEAFQLLLAIHSSLVSKRLMIEPDKTFLITDDPEVAATRGARKKSSVYDGAQKQRMIQEAFLWLKERYAGIRIEVIDGRANGLEAITAGIYERVKSLQQG